MKNPSYLKGAVKNTYEGCFTMIGYLRAVDTILEDTRDRLSLTSSDAVLDDVNQARLAVNRAILSLCDEANAIVDAEEQQYPNQV